MAADKLDALWEGWMADLSTSYAASLDLLEQSKTAEAAETFRRDFVVTVKKLYVEAGKTYPLRYEGATCWTDWTKQLYILTRKAEDAFKAGDIEAARKLLPDIRKHFYDLHEQTNRHKANDQIYAFNRLMLDGTVSKETLQAALDKVASAEPALKTNQEEFGKARDEWRGKIAPMIEAGDITPQKLDEMLKSTAPFYKSFGQQFE